MEREIWEPSIESRGLGKAPASEEWEGTRSQELDGMHSFWGLTASIAGLADGVIINTQNTKKKKKNTYQKSIYTHISIE